MYPDQDPVGEGGYLSADVARLAGVSLRQLQWWDERKLISPRKDDHRRIYAPEQVLEVLTVAALRRKGLSLKKIRKVLRQLHRGIEHQKKLMFSNAADFRLYLVTDGKSTWFDENSESVLTRLVGARTPMYVVNLVDQVNRITADNASRHCRTKQLPLFSAKMAGSPTSPRRRPSGL